MKRVWFWCVVLYSMVVACTSTYQSDTLPLATPAFDMPDYYTPHAALIYLGTDYLSQAQNLATTSTLMPTPTLDFTQQPEFADGIDGQNYSPDGKMVLVTTFVAEPSAPLLLGKSREQSLAEGFPAPRREDFYEQGWLVNLDNNKMKPLFAAYELFIFEWIDNRYGLIFSLCYGDPTIEGLHIIDTETTSLSTIDTSYGGNCEGGVGYNISPDGKHLIIGKKVVTIADNEQTAVCVGDEFARSYTWSPDGRFVYIACANEFDQLHRYDTRAHEEVNLTQNTNIAFKAIRMWFSSDGESFLFEWGTNSFYNMEEYGIWMLDLKQLDE